MARGDFLSVKILMDSLCKFVDCSGLHGNELKSNIFTADIDGPNLGNILVIINFPKGSMTFKYLCISFAAEGLKVMHFSALTNKIEAYFNAWSSSSLSFARRAYKGHSSRCAMLLVINSSGSSCCY